MEQCVYSAGCSQLEFHSVVPENIHTSPTDGLFHLNPLAPPEILL